MFDNNKIIKFEIVTPERVVLKEMIHHVTVPTTEGEITVLPKHEPLVAILKPGVIEMKTEKNDTEVVSVAGGFIEVLRNKVIILADTAERAEEIDIEKAEEAKKLAEENVKDLRQFDQERFANVNAVIAKELARTKAVARWKKIKKL